MSASPGGRRSILFSTISCGVWAAPISASTWNTRAVCAYGLRRRYIDHVQDQRRFGYLFQRGAERLDQRRGQVADEADGVAEQHAPARRQRQQADGRIERGEHLGVGEHARPGQPIEERRFAGVGVADQRQNGQRNGRALAAMQGAAGAHAFELFIYFLDAPRDSAAVGFELRFTRASGSDTAAQARHFDAPSGQARQHVVELRQLDLQAAFPRAGAAGEDIEDELRAVDDLDFERFFEIALLGGRQVVVEDDHGRADGGDRGGELAHLARSDERGGFDTVAALDLALDHDRAGARSQLRQLFERFFGIERLRCLPLELEPDQDRLLVGGVRRGRDARPPWSPGAPPRSTRGSRSVSAPVAGRRCRSVPAERSRRWRRRV